MSDDDWLKEAFDEMNQRNQAEEAERLAKWKEKIQPLLDAGITDAQMEKVVTFASALVSEARASHLAAVEGMLDRLGFTEEANGKWIVKRLAD